MHLDCHTCIHFIVYIYHIFFYPFIFTINAGLKLHILMIGLLGVHKLQFGQYFKDYSLLFPWPFLRQALIESEQNDSLFICNFFCPCYSSLFIYLRWFVNSGGPIEFQPFPEYFFLANIITFKIKNDSKEITC